MNTPLLSTVVLSWNRHELLARTVTSLLATVDGRHELFVVDNGSTDGSVELLASLAAQHPSLVPILLPTNIGGLAINRALTRCRGTLLHVSGNDLEYKPGWLARARALFDTFEDLGQLSVYAPVADDMEAWAPLPATLATRRGEWLYLASGNVGASCLLRREIWDRGVRIRNLPTSGRCLLPDDGRLSADVRRLGYLVAWAPENLAADLGCARSSQAWRERPRPIRRTPVAAGALLPELSDPTPACPHPSLWTMLDTHTPPVEWLEFVHGLVRLQKPQVVAETVAWLGHRTLVVADALRQNGIGHVFAFEADGDLLSRTRNRVEDAGLGAYVTLVGSDADDPFSVLPEAAPVDLCLVDLDGPEPLISLRALAPRLGPDALIVTNGRIGAAERDRHVRTHLSGAGTLQAIDVPGPRDVAVYRLHADASGRRSSSPASAASPRASSVPGGRFRSPNQFARPVELELTETAATFHGYQEFTVTPQTIEVAPHDMALRRKYSLLHEYLSGRAIAGRTVLDLGANAGFFCFAALQHGAARATAVDIDRAYVDHVERARTALGFARFEACEGNAADWHGTADCVLALALMHWIYSCTAGFESLRDAVDHLARLTRQVLFVEWIDPDDDMIQCFGHLAYGRTDARRYTREEFERALSSAFARVKRLGDVSATRTIYGAWTAMAHLEGGCPLPALRPEDEVLSRRLIVTHGGIDYWSVVYDEGTRITKQATLDLASREAGILGRLEACPYVPRVLGMQRREVYSVIYLERIHGESVAQAAPRLLATRETTDRFVAACLELLEHLQRAQVVHRDIRPDNLLVRDGLPVLVDFGWGQAPGNDTFDPWLHHGLAREPRPALDVLAEGTSADLYAMGRLLHAAFGTERPDLLALLSLMTASDPSLRLSDAAALRRTWHALQAGSQSAPSGSADLVAALVDRLFERASRHEALENAYQQAATARAHAERARLTLEGRLAGVEREVLTLRSGDESRTRVCAALLAGDERPDPGLMAALDASSREALLRLAATLRARGAQRPSRAIALGLLAGAPEGDQSDAWLTAAYLAASCSRALGDDDTALNWFEAVNERWREGASVAYAGGALFHRASIAEARSDLARAVAYLERCLQLMPDHAAASESLARLSPRLDADA